MSAWMDKVVWAVGQILVWYQVTGIGVVGIVLGVGRSMAVWDDVILPRDFVRWVGAVAWSVITWPALVASCARLALEHEAVINVVKGGRRHD